jgi:transposase-like protein
VAGPPARRGIYFIDAIVVKVRDGQVTNRPIYAAIGVSLVGSEIYLGSGATSAVKAIKMSTKLLTGLQQENRSRQSLRYTDPCWTWHNQTDTEPGDRPLPSTT